MPSPCLTWYAGRGVTSHVGPAASGHTATRWRRDTPPQMTSGHRQMTSRDTHTPPKATLTAATPNGHTPHRRDLSLWSPTPPDSQRTSHTHTTHQHRLSLWSPTLPEDVKRHTHPQATATPNDHTPQWSHPRPTLPEPAIPNTLMVSRLPTHTPTDTAWAHDPQHPHWSAVFPTPHSVMAPPNQVVMMSQPLEFWLAAILKWGDGKSGTCNTT